MTYNRHKEHTTAFKYTILIMFALLILFSCDDEDETQTFTADFSFQQNSNDPNTLIFENTSEGEIYYVRWIFGNGERTDRISVEEGQSMTILYPEQGEYEVEFTAWGSQDDLSNNQTVSKTINIDQNVFDASFDATINDGSENRIVLTNTTSGTYNNVEWLVDGEALEESGDQVEAYLPLKGQYSIEMVVSQDDFSQSVTQSVTIAADDQEYFDNFQLVWSDEFDGTEVDGSKWAHETGDGGWGNNEWQNYTAGDNSSVANGLLSISAQKIGEGQQVGDYTSSRLNSVESFIYGKFEIRAKMPDDKGAGVWPAIWMLGRSIQNGTDWPLCGEIDIMEYVSYDPNYVSSSIHTESNNHAAGNPIGTGHIPLETAEEEFHIYGLLWTEHSLKFYRDDMVNVLLTYERPNDYTKESWPFDDPFYILLNMAVGGDYGGYQGVDDSIFPATMEVDYVRVYQYVEPQ